MRENKIAVSLLYHDVLPPGMQPGSSGFPGADADIYKLKQSLFAEHLQRISELGPGPSPALFTFDDGGATADEPTARLLEERGWRGHFFVVTERVGQPGFLTGDQLRAMHIRGHVIGSHSHTHPPGFSRLSYERMLEEWRRSREILEAILGEPVRSASVPGGFYSRDVARAAREAGYDVLFNSEPTCRSGYVHGLRVLGRYGIQHKTSAETALRLARGDLAPRLRQAFFWNSKKPLKKLGGPAWLAFRRWFFKKGELPVSGS